jgi:hypothetical protein
MLNVWLLPRVAESGQTAFHPKRTFASESGTISRAHPHSTEGLKLPDAAVQRLSKKPGGHRVEPSRKHDENSQAQQLAITRGFAGRDGHAPTAPRRRVAFL